jgi:hypothetical protein
MKFDIANFLDICQEKPAVIKIGQKCPALYMKTSVRFIVAGDIKSQYKRSLRVKRYQADFRPSVCLLVSARLPLDVFP